MLIKHGTGKVTGVLNKEAVKKAKEKLATLESAKPDTSSIDMTKYVPPGFKLNSYQGAIPEEQGPDGLPKPGIKIKAIREKSDGEKVIRKV